MAIVALVLLMAQARLGSVAVRAGAAVAPFGVLRHAGTPKEMAELGVKWIRLQMYWDWGSRGKNHEFDPSLYAGVKVDEWVARGFKLYALLSNRKSAARPGEQEKFARFAYEFARYYAGKIDYIELMNEPPYGGMDMDAFTQAMVLASKAVKRANPRARVILDVVWLPEPYFAKLVPFIDVAAYHPYRWVPEKHILYRNPFIPQKRRLYDRPFEEWFMRYVRRCRKVNPGIQFMDTEVGFRDNSLNRDANTRPPFSPREPKDKWGGSEADTAKFLLRNAIIEMTLPVRPLAITWFYDRGTPGLTDGQALILYSGEKRKAYRVYKRLIKTLGEGTLPIQESGLKLVVSPPAGELHFRAFTQARDGGRVLLIPYWDGRFDVWKKFGPVQVDLTIRGMRVDTATRVELVDLWRGGRRRVNFQRLPAGGLRISRADYADYPFVLRIGGAHF